MAQVKEDQTKLSVAMCTFNGERFLKEQLDSILQQTRLPDELVICDDCSIDATREVIQRFAEAAPFPVALHINDRRIGSTRNFEKAIRLCDGDIIVLSDQDDVWLPSKLMRLEEAFMSSSSVGLVFSDAEMVDEDLTPLGYRLWQATFPEADRRWFRKGDPLRVLLAYNVVTGATLGFRGRFKELILPFPGNPESVGRGMIHDSWIALLIAWVADIAMIDQALIKYRQHGQQQLGAAKRRIVRRNLVSHQLEATRKWRESGCWNEIRQLEEIREGLLWRKNIKNSGLLISEIEKRLHHVKARAGMPSKRLARVPGVMRELAAFRYHRFSKGLVSAAKDLLL